MNILEIKKFRKTYLLPLYALLAFSGALYAGPKITLQTPGSNYRCVKYRMEGYSQRSTLPCFRKSSTPVYEAGSCRTVVQRSYSISASPFGTWTAREAYASNPCSTTGKTITYGRRDNISCNERIITYSQYRNNRIFAGSTIGIR